MNCSKTGRSRGVFDAKTYGLFGMGLVYGHPRHETGALHFFVDWASATVLVVVSSIKRPHKSLLIDLLTTIFTAVQCATETSLWALEHPNKSTDEQRSDDEMPVHFAKRTGRKASEIMDTHWRVKLPPPDTKYGKRCLCVLL